MRDQDPRKYAEECFRQAFAARNDVDRQMFLGMADAWLALALDRQTITLIGITADALADMFVSDMAAADPSA